MSKSKVLLYIMAVFGVVTITACEKVIDVNIKESASQVVIEGNITDDNTEQFVRLSRSVPYTQTNTYPPIKGATVTVSNDAGRTVGFKEVSPGLYTGMIKGIPGTRYALKVTMNGQIFTATSTMPQPVKLDSLSISEITFGGNENKVVAVHYTDPGIYINQYRFVMKVNGNQTRRVYASNDRLTNGNPVKDLLYYSSDDDNEEINKGDKIEVTMQCIDEPVYKYWITLANQSRNGPGGGTTPGNPPSNISNGALGYFSAHTVSRLSTVITE